MAAPDLVLLSGDVVQGGANTSEFACAHEWITRFCDAAGVPPDRVFVIPGNHDIDRHEFPDEHRDLLDLSKKATPEFRRAVDTFWDSPGTLAAIDAKFRRHREFAQRYAAVKYGALGSWRAQIEIAGISVDFLGLNSVWTGGHDDLDKPGYPVVGQSQRESLDELAQPSLRPDLTLVLQHNPTSYLNSIDALQHANWLDLKDALVFCGHLHESQMTEHRSMRGRHLELMGGALYAGYADRRRYSLGTIDLEPAKRSLAIALRAAEPDTESVFGRDPHRYQGARDGIARIGQGLDLPNLGHPKREKDQLEIDLERACLAFDGETYRIAIEKTYRNPTDRPWTHIEALILVNAHPDDPVRSRELYRQHPLELSDIDFHARCDGVEIEYATLHDLDSSKHLHLILGDGSSNNPGLLPEATAVLDYSFAVDRRFWGPYFERHIRRPTARIECELVFPNGLLESLALVANRNITDRDLTSQLITEEAADRVTWRWESDQPRLQARYWFGWQFRS